MLLCNGYWFGNDRAENQTRRGGSRQKRHARRNQEAEETNDDGARAEASLETRELSAEGSIRGESHFNLYSVGGVYIPYGILPDQARAAGMSISY